MSIELLILSAVACGMLGAYRMVIRSKEASKRLARVALVRDRRR